MSYGLEPVSHVPALSDEPMLVRGWDYIRSNIDAVYANRSDRRPSIFLLMYLRPILGCRPPSLKKKIYIYIYVFFLFSFFFKGGYLEVNHSNIQLFTNCSNFLLFVRFLLLDLIQFDRIMSYDSKLSSNQPLPHPRIRHFDRMPPSFVPSYLYNYIAIIMLHLSIGVDSFSSAELLVFNS